MVGCAWLLAAALLVSPGAGAGAADDTGDPRAPDIVVVMVDDLGAIDGRVLERLPNIRELWLDRGLRFDAAYSETPLCCPGRASFLTGQHTRKHRVFTNKHILRFDPTQTLATALDDAGYHTMLVGKYMNGAQKLDDQTPVGWDRAALMLRKQDGTTWTLDDVDVGSVPYDDRFLADTAAAWVQDAPGDSPMFLLATPFAPHAISGSQPWVPYVEDRYVGDERCTGIELWQPPMYAYEPHPDGYPLDEVCRSLLTVDDMVGTLRARMDERGRDTVWVFMSDNGMAWGTRGFPAKSVPWAARLPLYFAGSGVSQGATSALVSNIDIGPTLAEMAGTTMRSADGISFTSVLAGEPGGREWMFEDHPKAAYTGGPWEAAWWAVRTPNWRLIQVEGRAAPMLFHLTSDPWETVNVRKRHPKVVRELQSLAAPLLY